MENGSVIQGIIYSLMVLVLAAAAVIDIKEKIINQKLLWLLLAGSTLAVYISNELKIFNSIAAMLFIFLLLSFVYYISRKAIGWGDVKLCSCIAPYLGVEKAFYMLFVAMILCGFTALTLLCINKANKQKELPFAPFTAIGTIVALII